MICLSMLDTEDDRCCFEKIFWENHMVMYHIALGILHSETDAEDAVQEAFCKLAENFSKYFHLTGREMTALCVTIVKAKAVDILRRQKFLSDEQVENLVVYDKHRENQPEDSILQHEEQNTVHRALARLPEIYREVLELKFFYGMKVREIAKLLDISPKTAEMRLYRGQKKLKGIMMDEEEK